MEWERGKKRGTDKHGEGQLSASSYSIAPTKNIISKPVTHRNVMPFKRRSVPHRYKTFA